MSLIRSFFSILGYKQENVQMELSQTYSCVSWLIWSVVSVRVERGAFPGPSRLAPRLEPEFPRLSGSAPALWSWAPAGAPPVPSRPPAPSPPGAGADWPSAYPSPKPNPISYPCATPASSFRSRRRRRRLRCPGAKEPWRGRLQEEGPVWGRDQGGQGQGTGGDTGQSGAQGCQD